MSDEVVRPSGWDLGLGLGLEAVAFAAMILLFNVKTTVSCPSAFSPGGQFEATALASWVAPVEVALTLAVAAGAWIAIRGLTRRSARSANRLAGPASYIAALGVVLPIPAAMVTVLLAYVAHGVACISS